MANKSTHIWQTTDQSMHSTHNPKNETQDIQERTPSIIIRLFERHAEWLCFNEYMKGSQSFECNKLLGDRKDLQHGGSR